jgi:hypothetical protein
MNDIQYEKFKTIYESWTYRIGKEIFSLFGNKPLTHSDLERIEDIVESVRERAAEMAYKFKEPFKLASFNHALYLPKQLAEEARGKQ